MSLLTIVQSAAVELGFSQPTAALTSTDPTVLLLCKIASKEGKELMRRFDWQVLQIEGSFTTTATETQISAITTTFTDFDHIINGTMWNRTQNRPVRGPLTPAEWQQKKAATARVTIGNFLRIRGNSMLFFSTPASGDSIYFEYISNKWCTNAAGTTSYTDWNADSDVALIDEEIIRLGILWRYRKAKGFDYGEDFRTYEMALQDRFGTDAGKAVIDMTGDDYVGLGVNIAEGTWNLN